MYGIDTRRSQDSMQEQSYKHANMLQCCLYRVLCGPSSSICLTSVGTCGCRLTCGEPESCVGNIKDGTVSEDDNTEHREVKLRNL